MKYEYISYDVWGNESDGYEVNQAFTTGEYVELDTDTSDKELLISLIRQGFAKDSICFESVDIQGEQGYSLYFEYNGKPEFELRPV
jgi:hypothetical protein